MVTMFSVFWSWTIGAATLALGAGLSLQRKQPTP
jgi:hypothetical protein